MANHIPHRSDIEKALKAAEMLDIRLTDARYYLHSSSKMNKRLVVLVHATRDVRNELDNILAALPEEDER